MEQRARGNRYIETRDYIEKQTRLSQMNPRMSKFNTGFCHIPPYLSKTKFKITKEACHGMKHTISLGLGTREKSVPFECFLSMIWRHEHTESQPYWKTRFASGFVYSIILRQPPF